MKGNWIVKPFDAGNAGSISRRFSIPPDAAALIAARGFTDERTIFEFINTTIPRYNNPFLMNDMDRAVLRMRRALDANEKIALFSDSDIDGLTSLTLLSRLLIKLKSNFTSAYPENNDAYGVSVKCIDRFAAEGVRLLITLDCGVRDTEEIAYAVSKGIDVIVCDHHEAGEILPDAVIVNPKKSNCPYPFKGLAGASVAFKLCQALLYSYIPAFNKNKIFVMRVDGNYLYSNSVNGVVIERGERTSLDDIKAITDDPIFMHHDLTKDDLAVLEKRFGKGYDPLDIADSTVFFKRYGGVNKFLDALYEETKYEKIISLLSNYAIFFSDKINAFVDENIPFAALGTIADVMPILGENRSIVKYGLLSFEESSIPSIKKLREICRGGIDAKAVAWEISPLLNAPGRYGKTSVTADFLAAEGGRVAELYEAIKEINAQRRNGVSEIMKTIKSGYTVSEDERVLFVEGYDIHEGLTGLIASRVSDQYNKPVIVFSKTDEGIIKGSGRTSVDIDFLSFVEPHSSILVKFGGHAGAFGFSILPENVDRFKTLVKHSFESTTSSLKKYSIDAELKLGAINYTLMNALSLLEPFGAQNEEPLFLLRNIPTGNFKRFGSTENHGKFIVPGSDLDIIGWNMAAEMEEFSRTGTADIVFRIEKNQYNGRESLRLVIVDIG